MAKYKQCQVYRPVQVQLLVSIVSVNWEFVLQWQVRPGSLITAKDTGPVPSYPLYLIHPIPATSATSDYLYTLYIHYVHPHPGPLGKGKLRDFW